MRRNEDRGRQGRLLFCFLRRVGLSGLVFVCLMGFHFFVKHGNWRSLER